MNIVKSIVGIAILCFIIAGFSTCNYFSRSWGGTTKIKLEKDVRVVNCSWKGTDLWILTKIDATAKPTVYGYVESSTLGVLQGKVVITEQ